MTKEYETQWNNHKLIPENKDAGIILEIVARLGDEKHFPLSNTLLTVEEGVPLDRWNIEKDPERGSQITLINFRMRNIVDPRPGWQKRCWEGGDNFVTNLDISTDALPVGTKLMIGSALIEITDKPHMPCKKFSKRFGVEASKWVAAPEHLDRRLRGVKAKVITSGIVMLGDKIQHLP